MKKLILVVAALAVSATMANAGVIASTLQPCTSLGIALSAINPGCNITDKDFTNFTTWGGYTAFPGDWKIAIDAYDETHVVDIARAGGQSIGVGSYGIQYDVNVLQGAGMLIKKITLNLNSGTTVSTLYKSVYDLTPGNLGALLGSGSTAGLATNFYLVPASAHIRVQERVVVTGAGLFSSFTDSYTQVTPEPATYAMMGLGLAALGLISRRKKA